MWTLIRQFQCCKERFSKQMIALALRQKALADMWPLNTEVKGH